MKLNWTLIFYLLAILTIILAVCVLSGCGAKLVSPIQKIDTTTLTNAEKSELILEGERIRVEGEAKAESVKRLSYLQGACFVGFLLSLIGVGVLKYLRMNGLVFVGVLICVACGIGFGIATAGIEFPQLVAYFGVLVGCACLLGGLWFLVQEMRKYETATKEIVLGAERLKTSSTRRELVSPNESFDTWQIFKKSQSNQSPSTEKIVNKIKNGNSKEK